MLAICPVLNIGCLCKVGSKRFTCFILYIIGSNKSLFEVIFDSFSHFTLEIFSHFYVSQSCYMLQDI